MFAMLGRRDEATREAALFARDAIRSIALETSDPVLRAFFEDAARRLDSLLIEKDTPTSAFLDSGPFFRGRSLIELLLVDPFADDHIKLARALLRCLPWDGL